MEEQSGEIIAIGGGTAVRDIIQRGHNMGLHLHIMNGPYGASTQKAGLSGYEYSFRSPEDLLKRIYTNCPGVLHPEFDINKVRQYVQEARQEILRTSPDSNMQDVKVSKSVSMEEIQVIADAIHDGWRDICKKHEGPGFNRWSANVR